jgi:hypothetical protein
MKNKMNLEEEGLVWTAYLQFNYNTNPGNIIKYNTEETCQLFVDYVKAFDSVSQKNYGK